MDDDIIRRIGQLVEEEHRLNDHTRKPAASEDDHRRLRELEVQLDQCWDLLRQRRALRSGGHPVDEATVRSADVVEGYQQ